jgi:hypothetical protein
METNILHEAGNPMPHNPVEFLDRDIPVNNFTVTDATGVDVELWQWINTRGEEDSTEKIASQAAALVRYDDELRRLWSSRQHIHLQLLARNFVDGFDDPVVTMTGPQAGDVSDNFDVDDRHTGFKVETIRTGRNAVETANTQPYNYVASEFGDFHVNMDWWNIYLNPVAGTPLHAFSFRNLVTDKNAGAKFELCSGTRDLHVIKSFGIDKDITHNLQIAPVFFDQGILNLPNGRVTGAYLTRMVPGVYLADLSFDARANTVRLEYRRSANQLYNPVIINPAAMGQTLQMLRRPVVSSTTHVIQWLRPLNRADRRIRSSVIRTMGTGVSSRMIRESRQQFRQTYTKDRFLKMSVPKVNLFKTANNFLELNRAKKVNVVYLVDDHILVTSNLVNGVRRYALPSSSCIQQSNEGVVAVPPILGAFMLLYGVLRGNTNISVNDFFQDLYNTPDSDWIARQEILRLLEEDQGNIEIALVNDSLFLFINDVNRPPVAFGPGVRQFTNLANTMTTQNCNYIPLSNVFVTGKIAVADRVGSAFMETNDYLLMFLSERLRLAQ